MIGDVPQPRLVRIETAASADLDAVMAVMNSAFDPRFGEAWSRSQCAGILPMTGVSMSVAWDERREQPLGFSLFRTVAGESELLLLAVIPDKRRRGIGRRLLEDFMKRAADAGARRVHLEVRDGNHAVAMYAAAGFDAVGRRSDYYRGKDGSRFDAITLARAI